MTIAISKIFRTQLPHCSICQSETSDDDAFCQECGAALTQPVVGGFASNMGRLHPKWSRSVIGWPLISGLVLLFILLPMVLIGFEGSYSGFSSRYTAEQAQNALNEKRCDEAASLLQRLALNHPLNSEQKKLLNDVYFARADQRAAILNYASAIADLNLISADYSQYPTVVSKRAELTKLMTLQQSANKSVAEVSPQKSHTKRSRRQVNISDAGAANSTPVLTSNNSQSIQTNRNESISISAAGPRSSSFAGPSRSVANVLSMSDSLSNPARSGSGDHFEITSVGGSVLPSSKASQLKSTSVAKNEAPPKAVASSKDISPEKNDVPPNDSHQIKPVKFDITSAKESSNSKLATNDVTVTKNSTAKAPKSNESDMVRYNELLAGYFSQERKHSSASSEPPTFKEWIEQKRPTF